MAGPLIRVRVRYFARLREIAGLADELVELPADSDAAHAYDALCRRYPALGPLRGHVRVARNLDFVGWGATLHDGDELAFIPPVSGGSGRFAMTTAPLSLDAVVDAVRRPDAGAIVTFVGVVRDHTGERKVERLEYDAYVEMAERQLEVTAERAEAQWPVVVAIHHRYGALDIGEAAVVIAVSSAHRPEAFEACRFVIEELKREVPIWKKEIGVDGSEWVGRGP